jgi:ABC-type Fe3+-hydroxamate transport system substrate-binding protein
VTVRVVSLVPSSTETLLTLGAEVIACTRFCEQPGLPTVGGTKNPDLDAIVRLGPDLVVLDREENRIEDHDALVAAGLRVVASDVRSIEDALDVVDELAEAAAVDRPHLDPVPSTDPPVRATAFVPIWRRPWMSISPATYGGSLLRRLGIALVTDDADGLYPTVQLDTIAAREPAVVLVPSEPYEFAPSHLEEITAAIPGAQVRRVDGRDLFWWGTRTPGAVGRFDGALTDLGRRRRHG